MMKVALYLRVSTEDQAREGYSLEVQEEFLRKYAEQEKLQVYRVYMDDGISGYTKDRPELNRLLKDAANQKFGVVLVYKLDRFSRNMRDLLNLGHELSDYNVGFKSATEPFDTTTSAGKLMFQQLGSFAEFERNRIKERIFPGMIKGVKNGNWQGSRYSPYGYKYNKPAKLLEIIPSEAEVVKEIYRLYLMGGSTSEITAYLYQKDYRSRTGIKFGTKLVCDILKNKLYIGKLVWNRHHYSKDIKTKGGFGAGYQYEVGHTLDIIEAKGKHAPIISEDDFNRVQQRLALRRRVGKGIFNKYEHLLTGILRCGYCGYSFMGSTCASNHKTGARKKWYRCSLKMQTRGIECKNMNVVATAYDNFAINLMEKIAKSKMVREKRYVSLMKISAEPSDEILKQLKEIKALIDENREKQKKLTDLYLAREIGQEIFSQSQLPLKLDEDRYKKKIQVLEMKMIEREDSLTYNTLLYTILDNFPRVKNNLTISEKKALLRLVFKKIIIKEGVISDVDLYEPFKSIVVEAEIECLKKQVKSKIRQKNPVCTYARSDVR